MNAVVADVFVVHEIVERLAKIGNFRALRALLAVHRRYAAFVHEHNLLKDIMAWCTRSKEFKSDYSFEMDFTSSLPNGAPHSRDNNSPGMIIHRQDRCFHYFISNGVYKRGDDLPFQVTAPAEMIKYISNLDRRLAYKDLLHLRHNQVISLWWDRRENQFAPRHLSIVANPTFPSPFCCNLKWRDGKEHWADYEDFLYYYNCAVQRQVWKRSKRRKRTALLECPYKT